MFRKSVFYLDLLLDHREGANDNAFGTASAFSKTSAISERFDHCRMNPLCTTERCSPSDCAQNMFLLIVILCNMYFDDITKYLESLGIKNNFLSGLVKIQPPTKEIIGQKSPPVYT